MDALDGKQVKIPDATAILPYIGLFTLVTLNPAVAAKNFIITPHLPFLSIICNNRFEEAPANTSATGENVARIFDSLAIEEDSALNLSRIPLATASAEKYYWRIPVFPGAIFAALIARLQFDVSKCEDIKLARKIYGYLMVKTSDDSDPSGDPTSSGDHGGGDGPSTGRGEIGRASCRERVLMSV